MANKTALLRWKLRRKGVVPNLFPPVRPVCRKQSSSLNKVGYIHPVHPPLTHNPMGLVAGAFIFALVALLVRQKPKTS